jgi:ketosteroid isomerase-like protein
MRTGRLVVTSLLLVVACAGGPAPDMAPAGQGLARPRRLTAADYQAVMEQLADAWNRNDARRAADLFAERAVYSAPPDGRVRRGRDELFRFFGGPNGRPRPMRMEWHHLVFDEATQIGAGEYTFTYDIRTHGAVMVRVVDGEIANWREYERASPLDWKEFVGPNRF